MDHWWKRREKVKRGDYTEAEVEDLTGRIPLLLENCVVGNEIDLENKFFNEIYTQAVAFEQDIQLKCHQDELGLYAHSFYPHNFANVFRHYEYTKACLSGQPVEPSSKEISNLVDHRYFYDEFDPKLKCPVGNYTCGLSRNAVAASLLTNKVNFANRDFLESLPDYISNPCVSGFIIEQAVLSSIATSGLDIKKPEINRSMNVVSFQGRRPNFHTETKKPVLYIPQVFNFRGIDGVIVWIGPKPKTGRKTQKLFIFPLQITLAPDKHSDSHKTFLSEWRSWIEGLQEFDVVPEFIWITPNPPSLTKQSENSKLKWPEHFERYIHLRDVDQDIWNQYQLALESRMANQGEGSVEDAARVEEQESVEERGTEGRT